jgi:hypothetical protein
MLAKQLAQAARNAAQGELGRALAVSKLEDIKINVSALAKNIHNEGQALQDQKNNMLKKHQPTPLDLSVIPTIEKKAFALIQQLPKINELEKELEIQDKDAELAMIQKHIERDVQAMKSSLEHANIEIKDKIGSLPDADKIMTEDQYQDEMSFVLKH